MKLLTFIVLLTMQASVAIAAPGSMTKTKKTKSCFNRAQALANDDFARCYNFRTDENQLLSESQLQARRSFCKQEAKERKDLELRRCRSSTKGEG